MVLSSIVFAATRAILIDRRVAAAPSPRFVEQMFEFFQSHADSLRPGARVAIVVGDTVGVGMGRMLELKAEMLAPSLRMRVFRDPQTAARWLTRPGTAIVGNDRDE